MQSWFLWFEHCCTNSKIDCVWENVDLRFDQSIIVSVEDMAPTIVKPTRNTLFSFPYIVTALVRICHGVMVRWLYLNPNPAPTPALLVGWGNFLKISRTVYIRRYCRPIFSKLHQWHVQGERYHCFTLCCFVIWTRFPEIHGVLLVTTSTVCINLTMTVSLWCSVTLCGRNHFRLGFTRLYM